MTKLPPENPQISAPKETEGTIIEEDDVPVRGSVKIQQWKAPLPPPESFNKYPESIQNRIMALVEKENESRHVLMQSVLNAKISESRRGQHYSFVTIICAISISAVLVLNGHPLGLITLVGIIPTLGAFLEKLKNIFHSQKGGES